MFRVRQWAAILFAFLVPPLPASADATVALVQFEVTPAKYASWERFEAEVAEILEQAVAMDPSVILVVFPEYINVPILFAPYAETIGTSGSVLLALQAMGEPSLPGLVARRASESYGPVLAMWSRLARHNNVAILAGTAFAPVTEAGGNETRNRALLFDASGRLIYAQDKVFLTPFEQNSLDLKPGRLERAGTVRLGEINLGMTICRDSFFSDWEERLGHADVWIDLRANGETYSSSVRERFTRALPARVARTAARLGVNASLTGTYLDLFWQGHAFAVDKAGSRIAETSDPTGTELLIVSLPEAELSN